jgi:putative lipoprotein
LSHAQANAAQLTGTVAYQERIALPPDAVIDIQLVDSSVADIAAQTVAEALINAEGRQVPVSFTLTYDTSQIVPAHRYSVRATIRSGDGMLMFSTTQAYPVLTHGAPSKVNLILHTVGHGPKLGTSAKNKNASESAPAAQSPSSAAESSESKTPVSTAEAASPPATPAPSAERAASTTPAAQSSEPSTNAEPVQQPRATEPSETPTPSLPASSVARPPSTDPEIPPVSASPAATAEAEPPKTTEAPTATLEPAAPFPAAPSSGTSTASPEATTTAPEPLLPEAPSASIRAKPTAPETTETAPESDSESTSRPESLAPNKPPTPLADTQWNLIQLGGQDVVITAPQKPLTLAFSPEGQRIAGSSGCNSYIGTFSDNHGTLHLDPGNMTMMYCADPAASREKKFVAMLRSADGYKVNGDVLLLTHEGKTVAKFKTLSPL